jgi:hypothetical protein
MKTIEKIKGMDFPDFPDYAPDSLQQNVLNNLFLEILIDGEKFLISPKNELRITSPKAQKNVEEVFAQILENKDKINRLKWYLIYNLSIYSDLLECNSYLISSNRFLVIARILPQDGKDYDLEVQWYTIDELALQRNYNDKIYIGRDFISFSSFTRDHLGLGTILNSIVTEFFILKDKFYEFEMPKESELENYLRDIEQSVLVLSDTSKNVLSSVPGKVHLNSKEKDVLFRANHHFREFKHQLQDIMESLTDWERTLYKSKASKFARYITKFKKDIINNINYINAKVNTRITDFINEIKNL